eukprot:CAMPEP_0172632524 /NCGR_PEP_ID=MMETSP1068-20121228/184863_1 /TAXON_ID=35684 /ORGANISM="Pseudopedinella elastica, Strain CCMP716" /LENGTH=49 /DNA_ID= /DNA_START= /DNA_END= /DNA_ORIENTATION=
MDGEVMPTYLHMYDKVTVKRIASEVQSYLQRSDGLESPRLQRCANFKVG